MFTKSLWVLAVGCVAFVQGAGEDRGRKDLEALQGKWTMHALEINGKAVTQIQNALLTVTKDEYKTTVKGKDLPGLKIKLDASKNPKWIDMVQTQADGTEKVLKGIYKIENDQFWMCRGAAPEQERPNQFATWPDTNYFVVTWKRQAK